LSYYKKTLVQVSN